MSAAARGMGRRRIADAIGAPASTVGDWTRRAADNAATIRHDAVQKIVMLDQDLVPTAVHGTPLGDALEALGRLAMAITARFGSRGHGPWQLIAVATGGRLLRSADSG